MVCPVGSVGDAGWQRPAAPGGGALLCGGGDGGGHPELGQVRPQPLSSGEHRRDTLPVQCYVSIQNDDAPLQYYVMRKKVKDFTPIELNSE